MDHMTCLCMCAPPVLLLSECLDKYKSLGRIELHVMASFTIHVVGDREFRLIRHLTVLNVLAYRL